MALRIIGIITALFLAGFGYMYWVVLSSPKPDGKALFEAAFSNPISDAESLKADGYSTIFGTSRAWLTFKSQQPLQLKEAPSFKATDPVELKRYLPKDCGAVLDQASAQILMFYDQPNKKLKMFLQSAELKCYYEQRERGAR